jgi:hypothetical protein
MNKINATEMAELIPIDMDGDQYYLSLSFDIDDFIGDGVWYIQGYDHCKRLLFDMPFASSLGLEKDWLERGKSILCDFACKQFRGLK